MDTITIGLLLPSSTILPISKDLEKGFKEGIKQAGTGLEAEIIKEFIGSGDIKLVEKACDKLLNFDGADLVTGVASGKTIYDIAEKFSKQQVPLILNDLEATIPDVDQLNDHIFINSPHLWQHAYALGYWGVKTFGKKGMFIASVYDAGYSFSKMFYQGMVAADPDAFWCFSVPPMPPAGQLSNMDVIFPFLEKYEPDFIFAGFCGAETTLFLNEMIERGWHRKTKITGLPYLLEPVGPLSDDLTVYSTLPFGDEPGVLPAKTFYHLGLQSGLSVAKVAAAAADKNELQNELLKLDTFFNISGTMASDPIKITKNEIKAGEKIVTSQPVTSVNSYGLDIEKLRELTKELSTGWFNPYLCI